VRLKPKELDNPALRDALARGDDAPVNREWPKFIVKLEAMAEKNPTVVNWFDEFCKDQERPLR
jgi:hypothetical protein